MDRLPVYSLRHVYDQHLQGLLSVFPCSRSHDGARLRIALPSRPSHRFSVLSCQASSSDRGILHGQCFRYCTFLPVIFPLLDLTSVPGGVIYPVVFTQLQPRIGFGWTTRVIAFIILGTSVIPLLVMKSRTVASPWRTVLDSTAFRDIPYILLNTGLLFGFMGLWVIFYYIQLYALQQSSASSELASYLLVIINASSLPGRLLPGFYADRIGSINVQTVVAASSAVLTFCLIAIRSAAGLVVYSILYGFSAGAFMGLPAAGVARLSEDHSKIGIRLGMTLGFVGFGVLVSNPIAGAILAADASWIGLIVWCGALLTASAVSMAASRIVKVGYKLAKVI